MAHIIAAARIESDGDIASGSGLQLRSQSNGKYCFRILGHTLNEKPIVCVTATSRRFCVVEDGNSFEHFNVHFWDENNAKSNAEFSVIVVCG